MSTSSKTSRQRYEDTIICGDALETLQQLPSQLIDVVVTSPPYYQQRDYRRRGQLGREPTPTGYVERLVVIFSEIRRVLRQSGSLWIVLGDKYVRGELLGLPWQVANMCFF